METGRTTSKNPNRAFLPEEAAAFAAVQEEELALSELIAQWENEPKESKKPKEAISDKKLEGVKKAVGLDFLEESREDLWDSSASLETDLEEGQQLSWGWLLARTGIFCLFVLVATLWTWVHVSTRSGVEELRAAIGVADLSMAFIHAHVHQAKPGNRNWVDHEFLKNNLYEVLSSTYSSTISMQSSGELLAGNYHLRINTDKDLSHFVIIAQPPPTFFHFLVTPSAIVFDSSTMKLHKIEDLRPLNRLLAHANPLEGVTGEEITHLIGLSQPLHLSQIASESDHPEFCPPRELSWIASGAENFVYNAPRYYKFCQSFLQKAVAYSVQEGEKPNGLAKESKPFEALSSFVFYSSQGKGTALLVQKALYQAFPDKRPLIGYLTFHVSGQIASAHLLKENMPKGNSPETTKKAFAKNAHVAQKNLLEGRDAEEFDGIDREDPLFVALQSLAAERQKLLSDICEEWVCLLRSDVEKAQENFLEVQQELFDFWNQVRREQEMKIRSGLIQLQEQHALVPFSHFEKLSRIAGLASFLNPLLQEMNHEKTRERNQTLEEWLYCIRQSTSWEELASRIKEASSYLKLQHIPQSAELSRFQNRVRNAVISRLDDFLFSPVYHLSQGCFTKESRRFLKEILQDAWIADQEERKFYLDAFESRAITSSSVVCSKCS